MPMEMKKMPAKLSLSGWMSASTWWLYSESEISRPATNAPSASEMPDWKASQAVPRQMSSTNSTKISWFRSRATWWRNHGTTKREAVKMSATASNAFPSVSATTWKENASVSPSTGTDSIMGTAMMSWSSSVPNASRPWRAASSSRSL